MTDVSWLNDDEDRAWRGLRRVHLLAMAEVSRDLNSDSALSDADYEVLSTLSEFPQRSCRYRDLAAAIHWSTSRLSHQLRRMEARGLVSRRASPTDGRGSEVELTESGWSTLRAAAGPHVQSVRRHIFDSLTSAQTRQLADIATRIVAVHERDHRDGR